MDDVVVREVIVVGETQSLIMLREVRHGSKTHWFPKDKVKIEELKSDDPARRMSMHFPGNGSSRVHVATIPAGMAKSMTRKQ